MLEENTQSGFVMTLLRSSLCASTPVSITLKADTQLLEILSNFEENVKNLQVAVRKVRWKKVLEIFKVEKIDPIDNAMSKCDNMKWQMDELTQKLNDAVSGKMGGIRLGYKIRI